MKKVVMAAMGGTLAGIVATTQFVGPLVAQESARSTNVYEQLDLFGDIFERIRAQYVEEVDAGDLIEAAIDGMLTSLDPHSSYLSPNDAADMRVQTRGEFGGPRWCNSPQVRRPPPPASHGAPMQAPCADHPKPYPYMRFRTRQMQWHAFSRASLAARFQHTPN